MLEIDTSKFNYFLFDFDGTLVDTEKLHYEAYTGALKSIGLEYVPFEEHVKFNVGPSSEEVLRKELRKNGRTEVGLDELVLLKKYIFSQNILQNGVKAVDGAIELLYTLKQKGVKLAMVSGGKYEAIIRVMMTAGIPNIFDIFVTREIVKNLKPDPESYEKAIQMLGAKKELCMAFESDLVGLEASLKAGVKSIAIARYKYDDQISDKYPEVPVLRDFRDIPIK